MINRNKGNHSINTWEDQYYDGYEVDTYDHRMVSDEIKQGTEDCVKYIEEIVDNEYFWYKNITRK
ncbi:hypothetical protein EDO6_02463 [Paenibacillus xylanexedens]|nr:hypothetical protein EDO6_02463 [Paenibacillus xylanexedens]